jgi:transcriptional regulator with XRE-family HTH domain
MHKVNTTYMIDALIVPRMTIGIGKRLIAAREARGLSRERVAEILQISVATVQHHESERNQLRPDMIAAYARLYRIDANWLLTSYGRGPDGTETGVPLLGKIGAGAIVIPVDSGAIDQIEPPPGCPPGAHAFRVEGDSQYPAYYDGDIVVAVPSADVLDIVNRDAVVDLADGRRLLKRLALGSGAGKFHLLSHNAPPIQDAEIVRFMRVKYVIRD